MPSGEWKLWATSYNEMQNTEHKTKQAKTNKTKQKNVSLKELYHQILSMCLPFISEYKYHYWLLYVLKFCQELS